MDFGDKITLSDLPVWRRCVLFLCVGLFVVLGLIAAFQDARIYISAPRSPQVETKQVSPVYVMHSQVRYVNFEQEEKLIFWKQRLGLLVGIPFVIALLVVVTTREIMPWAND